MNCHCGQPTISERNLCEAHFIAWFEERVFTTVDEYAMISPGEKVLVAASGGKDSLTLLHIMKKRYDVTAFCVDEGIAGYREHTIVDLKRICEREGVPFIVRSFKEEKGATLDEINPDHPCTTCGVYRRDLIADEAKQYDDRTQPR